MSDKFEYFAIRNSAAVIDTSPLYKYRIYGSDAERSLSGVLTRDIRKCRPGQAHYTAWCDDDGWVIEDGVILRLSDDEFLLTAAEPNLAYLSGLCSGLRVEIEDVSDEFGALALQGPYAREILSQIAPEMSDIGYFHLTPAKIGDAPVTISRTGYTGDLGYEIWVGADDALDVWDRLFEVAAPYGVIPAGQTALLITRIEAGLILIDVDFYSSRYAWNDDQRATALELNMGWMVRDLAEDDRAFVGRRAIEREMADDSSRWKTVGVMAEWVQGAKGPSDRGLLRRKVDTPERGGMVGLEV
jgi:aminomethyltransferase